MLYDIDRNEWYIYMVSATQIDEDYRKGLCTALFVDKDKAREKYNELIEKYKNTFNINIRFVNVESGDIIGDYETNNEIC